MNPPENDLPYGIETLDPGPYAEGFTRACLRAGLNIPETASLLDASLMSKLSSVEQRQIMARRANVPARLALAGLQVKTANDNAYASPETRKGIQTAALKPITEFLSRQLSNSLAPYFNPKFKGTPASLRSEILSGGVPDILISPSRHWDNWLKSLTAADPRWKSSVRPRNPHDILD